MRRLARLSHEHRTSIAPARFVPLALLFILLTLLTLLAATAPAAAPADVAIDASSRIDRVTVYPDRAAVERLAEGIAVGRGGTRVVFADLPPTLIPESVRASGEGTTSVRIAHVDVARTFLANLVDARAESLQLEMRALDLERDKLRARKDGHAQGEEFLKSIRMHEEQHASERIAQGSADVAQLRGVFEFLTTELGENRGAMLDIEQRIARLDERIGALHRELKSIRGRARTGTWTATVDVVADAPGQIDLRLDYAVTGASWYPSYDVRVSEDLARIELVYYGQVSQQSGEAWDDVAIALSTAEPALGVQAPQLPSWWLAYPQPVEVNVESTMSEARIDVQYQMNHRKIGAESDALASVEGASGADAFLAAAPSAPREAAQHNMVAVPMATSAPGITARFDVPARQSLRADGTVRRMTVTSLDLTGTVSYESVPKLAPYAYLVASVQNTSDTPLLDGATQVFLGSQFLGAGRMASAAPGQKFDLSLGVDKAVSVARELVRRERRAAARADGDERFEYVYRTKIENHRRVPIEIRVRDQFPVAQDRAIEVTEKRLAPEPAERVKEIGQIAWKLAIPSEGTETLEMGFEVKYPSGRPPMGLF